MSWRAWASSSTHKVLDRGTWTELTELFDQSGSTPAAHGKGKVFRCERGEASWESRVRLSRRSIPWRPPARSTDDDLDRLPCRTEDTVMDRVIPPHGPQRWTLASGRFQVL